MVGAFPLKLMRASFADSAEYEVATQLSRFINWDRKSLVAGV